MSEKAKQIAERVANRLTGNSNDEVVSLRENIARLNSRIQQLESQIVPDNQDSRNLTLDFGHRTSDSANHPSLDKFNVAEAVVEELVSFFEQETVCLFEPNKPCDKCSMCSSRGF